MLWKHNILCFVKEDTFLQYFFMKNRLTYNWDGGKIAHIGGKFIIKSMVFFMLRGRKKLWKGGDCRSKDVKKQVVWK